jgi:hypothetical protein
VRHGDLVVGVEANKFFGRLAGAVDDAPDVFVVDADDRVTATVAATGAAKLQIFFPGLGHYLLQSISTIRKGKIR